MNTIFEWDEEKARSNIIKHGVSFEVAVQVFQDPLQKSRQDRFENGEYRWQTIGMVNDCRIVLVAHVNQFDDNTEIIRIISARKVTKQERKYYGNS